MKNATKHAEELRSLCRKVLRDVGAVEKPSQEPLKALVRAAMTFDVSDSRAQDSVRAIEKEFVDLNELRVATDLEIQELLGVRYPEIEKRVAMITQALNDIFEREHTLSLDRLKTVSRREARQFLRELPSIHPFVEAYVMLMAFDGAAFPIDQMMLEFLKEEGALEDSATIEDAQRFVEHHLDAEKLYPFFVGLRTAAAEAAKGRKKQKA
jgi:hypothetical protein